MAEKYPTRGFDVYYLRILQEGLKWNRKRVLRVYRLLNLKLRRKRKRRLPSRIQKPLIVPMQPNETWSMDLMANSLENGRRLRVLNIIDDFNREALCIDAQFSYPASYVVRALEILEMRGLPKSIRVDNGPEFLSNAFKKFCLDRGVEIRYIQPGKPTQNAYVERFSRHYREDVLDAYLFNSLEQVRILSDKFRNEYNANHPHSSLGGASPIQYLHERGNDSSENVKARMNDSRRSSALTFSTESIDGNLRVIEAKTIFEPLP